MFLFLTFVPIENRIYKETYKNDKEFISEKFTYETLNLVYFDFSGYTDSRIS